MSTPTPEEQLKIVRKRIIKAEKRVSEAKEDLRKLLSQHNSLTLICRLPNEVLGLIFVSCVTDALTGTPFTVASEVYLKRYSTRFSWIWVTHVCRHWREVALSCPAMWSTPLFDKPPLAREMLMRARDAPLRIHVRAQDESRWIHAQGYHHYREALLKAVVQDSMPRITELHIESGLSQHLLLQMTRPAPSLRSLEIAGPSHNASHNEVQLPGNFLAGNVPCLRELKLRFCHLHWHRLDLSNIRSLTLISEKSFTEWALLKSLLQSLQTMQNLRHPELDSHRPESSFGVVDTLDTTISLSKLESVIIRTALSTCTSILSCIIIPPKATVAISTSLPSGGIWMTSPNIISLLIEHIEGYEVKAISLETGLFSFGLKIFNQDLRHTYRPSKAKPHVQIDFLRLSADARFQVRCMVKQSLEALPLSRLPVIHLAIHNVLFVDDYLDYFSELKHLHTISVEGDCAHTLLEALGRNAKSSVMNRPSYTLAVGCHSGDADRHTSRGQNSSRLFGQSQEVVPRNASTRKHPKLRQIRQFLGAKSESFWRSQAASTPSEPLNMGGRATGRNESIKIPQSTIPFASLKTIVFWNVNWSEPTDIFNELLNQLHYRSVKGVAIQKIVARAALSFPQGCLWRLQEVVETVEWDCPNNVARNRERRLLEAMSRSSLDLQARTSPASHRYQLNLDSISLFRF